MEKFLADGQVINGLVRVKVQYKEPNGNEVTIQRVPGEVSMRVLNRKTAKKALDDVIAKNRRKK